MKKCMHCGEIKPLSEFYKHPETTDGHLGNCKTCKKKATDEVRRANPDRYREYNRKANAKRKNR